MRERLTLPRPMKSLSTCSNRVLWRLWSVIFAS
jgi:hypothetical protein